MKHSFLMVYEHPHKEIVTSVFSIYFEGENLEPSQPHFMPRLRTNPDDKALIMSIEVVFALNHYPQDIVVNISDLFPPTKNREEHIHPDYTGRCFFTIPAGHNGAIHRPISMVYQPNMVNLGVNICTYAGIEDHIAGARSTVASSTTLNTDSYQVFRATDPIVIFLVSHSHNMTDFVPADMILIKEGDETFYMLSKSIIANVQRFFRNTIYPLFHYTKFENTKVTAKRDDEQHQQAAEGRKQIAYAVFEVQYVLIRPTIPQTKARSILLKK